MGIVRTIVHAGAAAAAVPASFPRFVPSTYFLRPDTLSRTPHSETLCTLEALAYGIIGPCEGLVV